MSKVCVTYDFHLIARSVGHPGFMNPGGEHRQRDYLMD